MRVTDLHGEFYGATDGDLRSGFTVGRLRPAPQTANAGYADFRGVENKRPACAGLLFWWVGRLLEPNAELDRKVGGPVAVGREEVASAVEGVGLGILNGIAGALRVVDEDIARFCVETLA